MTNYAQIQYKIIVFLLALCPFLLMLFSAVRGTLGADPAEALAHQSGEWTLRFLLFTLAMTPIRSLTRYFWVMQYRRMLGLFTFFYALLHLLVYLFFLLALEWHNIFNELLERPYITAGFAAFVLLLPLVVTSTQKSRFRLGAKWKKLHALIYLIAILSLIHLWWQLRSDAWEAIIYSAIFIVLMLLRLPLKK